jgi:hypothetical protein
VCGRILEIAANFQIYQISTYIPVSNILDTFFEYLAVDFDNTQGGVQVTWQYRQDVGSELLTKYLTSVA